jgi:hypothetical protein
MKRQGRSPIFRLFTASLAAAALFSGPVAGASAATADAGGGRLIVTAVVPKRASMMVLSQPGSVLVTDVDVARGYVEVPAAVRVAIQSNSRAGYMLVFSGQGDFVRTARISGLASDVQLGASGGLVPQPSAGRGVLRTTVELRFRFFLAANTRQGEYPWPMRLSVVPL